MAFFNAQGDRPWIDLPANCHNNAGGFASADRHSEFKKCKVRVTPVAAHHHKLQPADRSCELPGRQWGIKLTSAPRRR